MSSLSLEVEEKNRFVPFFTECIYLIMLHIQIFSVLSGSSFFSGKNSMWFTHYKQRRRRLIFFSMVTGALWHTQKVFSCFTFYTHTEWRGGMNPFPRIFVLLHWEYAMLHRLHAEGDVSGALIFMTQKNIWNLPPSHDSHIHYSYPKFLISVSYLAETPWR